jgi:hypothetical protein
MSRAAEMTAAPKTPSTSARPAAEGLPREIRRDRFIRYGAAILIMAAAFGVAVIDRPHVGGAVFAPLFAGLAICVWFGGTGPAILALVVAVPLSRFLLVEPLYSFEIGHGRLGWIVFVITGGVIVALGASLHRGRAREMEARRAAERERRRAEAAALELRELQRVTALLSTARDPSEVAEAVLTGGLRAMGARCGAVLVYDAERKLLRIERAIGYPPGALDEFQAIPLGADVPVAVAAQTRTAVLLHDPAEISERFPRMIDVFAQVGRAGAILPLLSDGRLIGGIVLVFAEDQTFSAPQLSGLTAFATVCGRALDRARQQQSDHEISVRLQNSLLPGTMPALEGAELAVRYLPAGASADVGGDWYDAAVLPNGRLVVTVGDVGGKGVAAAALMGRLRIGLKAYAIEGYSPSEIVSRLDRLAAHIPETEFTTLAVASIELTTGEVRLCRAGHMPPLLIPAAGSPRFVSEGGSAPVGLGLGDEARSETTVRLGPGDAILLFTDGLVERRDRPLSVGFDQLATAVASHAGQSAEAIADTALAARDDAGATPPDDIALLVIRYTPIAAAAT